MEFVNGTLQCSEQHIASTQTEKVSMSDQCEQFPETEHFSGETAVVSISNSFVQCPIMYSSLSQTENCSFNCDIAVQTPDHCDSAACDTKHETSVKTNRLHVELSNLKCQLELSQKITEQNNSLISDLKKELKLCGSDNKSF